MNTCLSFSTDNSVAKKPLYLFSLDVCLFLVVNQACSERFTLCFRFLQSLFDCFILNNIDILIVSIQLPHLRVDTRSTAFYCFLKHVNCLKPAFLFLQLLLHVFLSSHLVCPPSRKSVQFPCYSQKPLNNFQNNHQIRSLPYSLIVYKDHSSVPVLFSKRLSCSLALLTKITTRI